MGQAQSDESKKLGCQLELPEGNQSVTINPLFTTIDQGGLRLVEFDNLPYPFKINLTVETLLKLQPAEHKSISVCRALVFLLNQADSVDKASQTILYRDLQRKILSASNFDEDISGKSGRINTPLFAPDSSSPLKLLDIYLYKKDANNITYTVVFLSTDKDIKDYTRRIYLDMAGKLNTISTFIDLGTYFTMPGYEKYTDKTAYDLKNITTDDFVIVSSKKLNKVKNINGDTDGKLKANLLKTEQKMIEEQFVDNKNAMLVPYVPENSYNEPYVPMKESKYKLIMDAIFNTPQKVKNFLLTGNVDGKDDTPGRKNLIRGAAVAGLVGGIGALAYNKRDDLSSLWTKAKGKVCTPADLTAIIQKLESVAEELDGELEISIREAIDQLKGIQTKKKETTDFEQSDEDVQSSDM